MRFDKRQLPKVLAALVAFLVALAGAFGVGTTINDGASGPSPPVVKTVPQPHDAGDLGPAVIRGDVVPLKDDTPPGVSKRQLDAGRQATDKLAEGLTPQPIGGAQSYTCRQKFDPAVYSSRNGRKPTEFVVHYTAGNGTADSIWAYFHNMRGASATYILEPGGRCIQEVPEGMKPWTQLSANPTSISVEIVTTGWNLTRAQWLAMAIFKKGVLASLMRDSMHRNGIPLRHVDPVGCNFVPGWTDHNALECGNDHTDVLKTFPYDVLQKQLVAGQNFATRSKVDRWCRSHRIVHAKLGPKRGSRALRDRNRKLHVLLKREHAACL